MTRFFVGQRVRIKWAAEHAKHLVGKETQIIGQGPFYDEDFWITDLAFPDDVSGFWRCRKSDAPDIFEPIITSGHQPAEMDVHELLPFLKGRVTA